MSFWTTLSMPAEHELVVGLYDLTKYTIYCQQVTSLEALDLVTRFHALAGQIIHRNDGLLIKVIGDAGLFAYPADQADAAIAAALDLRSVGDPWLSAAEYPGRVRTVMHVGPAAIGPIGGPGREQIDIIGGTVNIVGAMRTESFLAMTPALFRRSSPASRTHFKKHTPPVSYITLDDPRPRV